MTKYEVHVSDVRQFKTCRRAWSWSSPIGLNLEPDKPYAPFFTGRIIHTALELYYRSDGMMNLYDSTVAAITIEQRKMEKAGTIWEQEQEMFDEQIELCYGLMEHYEIWQESKEQENNVWGDANLEFLDMETSFVVPIYTEKGHPSSRVELGGRFDGLVRRLDDGTLWLFESKTTRSISELQKTLSFDEQAGAYIYAAQEMMGEQIHGVLYNIMRKKVPTKARELVAGGLSKAQNIDTTLAYYWRQLQDTYPDATREELISEYQDILDMLHNKGNTFFSRTVVRRTKHEIDELHRNLRVVGLEMVRPSTVLYPAPSWTACTFCRFKAPCLAVNAGADTESLFEMDYRQRKDRVYRPWLLYGYHFVPIAEDSVDVWFYGELIVSDASSMTEAFVEVDNWIIDMSAENEYIGPSIVDLIRGAKEIGVWQDA